jgi:hypothetical protein
MGGSLKLLERSNIRMPVEASASVLVIPIQRPLFTALADPSQIRKTSLESLGNLL